MSQRPKPTEKISVTMARDDLRELLYELQLRNLPGPTASPEAGRALRALREQFDKTK
jgi:hypothetical protein